MDDMITSVVLLVCMYIVLLLRCVGLILILCMLDNHRSQVQEGESE